MLIDDRDPTRPQLNPAGLNYAPLSKTADDTDRSVLKTITGYNQKQRKALHQLLGEMHPYQFEQFTITLKRKPGHLPK